jgi:hypothetical protein
MRAAIQAASGKAEEEPIAELLATTTTRPVVVWAPIRAAEGLRDKALSLLHVLERLGAGQAPVQVFARGPAERGGALGAR